MEKRLRIAIQKSGRLSEKSLEIIRSCGIDFSNDSRVLREVASNFPIEFLFVRDDDIPTYVYDNVADIGIVGRNELDESGFDLEVVRDLGFASCRSVEITPAVGIADCICDLVSTGTTLKMNGLKEVDQIYFTSAVMVSRRDFSSDAQRYGILERLLVRMDTVNNARKKKYILFNLPCDRLDDAAEIIGGMKSPTVTPLLDKDWLSVQSVVSEDRFWSVFEDLKALGAEGILVMPIEKMSD